MTKFWKPKKKVLESLGFEKRDTNWWKKKVATEYGSDWYSIMWQKDYDGEYSMVLRHNGSDRFIGGGVESEEEFMLVLKFIGWGNISELVSV